MQLASMKSTLFLFFTAITITMISSQSNAFSIASYDKQQLAFEISDGNGTVVTRLLADDNAYVDYSVFFTNLAANLSIALANERLTASSVSAGALYPQETGSYYDPNRLIDQSAIQGCSDPIFSLNANGIVQNRKMTFYELPQSFTSLVYYLTASDLVQQANIEKCVSYDHSSFNPRDFFESQRDTIQSIFLASADPRSVGDNVFIGFMVPIGAVCVGILATALYFGIRACPQSVVNKII
jgi:hypothetical protein